MDLFQKIFDMQDSPRWMNASRLLLNLVIRSFLVSAADELFRCYCPVCPKRLHRTMVIREISIRRMAVTLECVTCGTRINLQAYYLVHMPLTETSVSAIEKWLLTFRDKYYIALQKQFSQLQDLETDDGIKSLMMEG